MAVASGPRAQGLRALFVAGVPAGYDQCQILRDVGPPSVLPPRPSRQVSVHHRYRPALFSPADEVVRLVSPGGQPALVQLAPMLP